MSSRSQWPRCGFIAFQPCYILVLTIVFQALFDLEATNNELKADLRDLYITAAKEIDIHNSTRKAIIVHVSIGPKGRTKLSMADNVHLHDHVFTQVLWDKSQVPYRLLKQFHKIQQRLVRELEKKFSGKDVVLIANRRILPPSSTGKATDRPRSRTLSAVRACVSQMMHELHGMTVSSRLPHPMMMAV